MVLVPLNLQKSAACARSSPTSSTPSFTAAGIEVLYDDRDARPGVKFADAELLGIPHRLVVGERGLEAGKLEYRGRRDSESQRVPLGPRRWQFIRARLAGLTRCAAWRAWLAAALVCTGAGLPSAAHADAQRDPELRASCSRPSRRRECFADQYDSAVWYTLMEPRLRTLVKDKDERIDILKQVYCETHRTGEARLPPGLVHGGHRRREPLRPLGRLQRRRRRA